MVSTMDTWKTKEIPMNAYDNLYNVILIMDELDMSAHANSLRVEDVDRARKEIYELLEPVMTMVGVNNE